MIIVYAPRIGHFLSRTSGTRFYSHRRWHEIVFLLSEKAMLDRDTVFHFWFRHWVDPDVDVIK